MHHQNLGSNTFRRCAEVAIRDCKLHERVEKRKSLVVSDMFLSPRRHDVGEEKVGAGVHRIVLVLVRAKFTSLSKDVDG